MPILSGLLPFATRYFLMTYGGKTGRLVAGSTTLAPRSGWSSCDSNARSVSMP